MLPRPPADEGFRLLDALHRLGARHVTTREDRVVALLEQGGPSVDATLADLRAAVRATTTLDPSRLEWQFVEEGEVDSEWHRDFRPFQASPRLRVIAAASQGEARPDVAFRSDSGNRSPRPGPVPVHLLRLSPGTAFGTPAHPTTRSCLQLLDDTLSEGESLVDVGAGSGILAIAAALLGARGVTAIEMEASACRAALRNCLLNGVEDRVEVRHQKAAPETLVSLEGAHGAMANLEPDILVPLLPSLARIPRPGGWLLVSGIPRSDKPRVTSRLGALDLTIRSERLADGWWSAVWVRVDPTPTEPGADPPGR